jgi:ATP-binding cassette subfamily C protein CydD
VGEGGGNFSGGEIQRLALARAYARHARVLIMDEATASLDPQTEAAVLDALTALNEGCTTIIIAHRLAVAERADQILVLEAGRLMQSGTHAELLAVAGPYRELARAGEAANV